MLSICDDETQTLLNLHNKNKSIFLHCLCHCGNNFNTSNKNIKRIKSCGCSRTDHYKNADKEIGKKYNKLTIVSINKNRTEEEYAKGKKYGVFYDCKCDCGSDKIVTAILGTLKTNHIKSCGCSKFNNPLIMEDLTGMTFNRLTVLYRDFEKDKKLSENGKGSNVHWICKCNCGNSKLSSVTGWCLKSGKTKSCGCLASEITAERNRRDSTKINRVFRCKENIADLAECEIVKVYSENGENFFTVDLEDYDYIKKWFWRKDKKGYWCTNSKKEDVDNYGKFSLKIHQIVAERKYGAYDTKTMFPDHLSRDKSDNTRKNLILKSNIENTHNRTLSKANTSGKTGVYVNKDNGKYIANITVNYKTIKLGEYYDFEEAVNARKLAEIKYGFTCDDIFPEQDI